MKKSCVLYNLYCSILVVLSISSCIHEEIEPCEALGTARIPVRVVWDQSGIDPSSGLADDYVHRVSLRFFPKNGNEPFEQYLETSVYTGTVDLPIGSYSIMAMNESILDTYWADFVTFSNVNDFNQISATILPINSLAHEYYCPSAGENFISTLPKMASWSQEQYNVTQELVTRTRSEVKNTSVNDTIYVVMRQLTHHCKIVATVHNLSSSMLIRAAKQGFTNAVNLTTAATSSTAATLFVSFDIQNHAPNSKTDGSVEVDFRTFGKTGTTVAHMLQADVILRNGKRYTPEDSSILWFDVSKYVDDYFSTLSSIRQNRSNAIMLLPISLALPEVIDGIGVDEWEDDEVLEIK